LFFVLAKMAQAQQLSVIHYIQLEEISICYIEARKLDKIDNSWEDVGANISLES